MDYNAFFEEIGTPFTGRRLKRLQAFLQAAGLDYDPQIEYTVCLTDREGDIAATGSLHGNVLKCIAVDERYQGCGLSARVVTALLNRAYALGLGHLFLFTKPKNRQMFTDLGFYAMLETRDILLMENTRDGIGRYLRALSRPAQGGVTGAVVANCNPFTLGHRYLIEQAAAQCDTLHLFILSEDRSAFPADVRYELAARGTADLPNVWLHPTSDYLISAALFPTYFIKDKAHAAAANCELDVRLFGRYFARELGITRRFVGTEPFCPVTSAYNDALRAILPEYGVQLIEIPRMTCGGTAVSASFVRRCMAEGDLAALRPVVPESTYTYIASPAGQALCARLAQEA